MVGEVNRLILNTIASKEGVLLPEVGTLYVCRKPAEVLSRGSVAVPHYDIAFSSHREAQSLVDIIATTANIDRQQALDIYGRWLDKVRTESGLNIEGVGVLNNKSFVVDKELIRLLNPYVANVLEVTRRSSKVSGRIAVGAMVMLLIVCAVGGWLYLGGYQIDNGAESGVVSTVITENDMPNIPPRIMTTPANIVADVVDTLPIEEPLQSSGSIEEAVVSDESILDDDWRTKDDIRHYVVVGSYSTEENVRRAIATLEERYTELRFSHFKLGTMYAVAAFGSSQREACEEFSLKHRDDFSQSWIHTPRKYKE